MTEIQEKLLDMLKWYHNFCVENNLRYYAIGGTTLGAVRHNGFIPWDDDVDVGMPRPDYERFKELAEKKINEKTIYCAEFPSDKEDFVYPFGKLYDTRTTLIENKRYKPKRGIYLDIFPIDGCGNSLDAMKKREKELRNLNRLLCTRVCAVRKGRSFYKNIAVIFSNIIPDFLISSNKIIKKIDEMCKQNNYDNSQYIGQVCNIIDKSRIQDKNVYGKPTLHRFEDTEIYIQENAEAYLECIFGEWEKLPPPEQQESIHDFLELDLNKSYIEK